MTGKFFQYGVIILLLLFAPLTAKHAYAVCANPAMAEGTLIYNDDENVLQFCDGTTWQGVNKGEAGSGGCINPVRFEGAVIYNADFNVPQLCSGSTWVLLGKANTGIADCPNIGDVCFNGDVYAGLSGAATPMYVPRCDGGQTWDGASCTGTRSTLPWNNGNGTGYVDTTLVNGANTDGQTYTTTLVSEDSDSVVGGSQQHQAAQYCNDLVMHGYSDWYLPAKNELNTLYSNEVAIANFDISGTYYWSSSEANDNRAWRQRFSDGTQNDGAWNKSNTGAIRCARR